MVAALASEEMTSTCHVEASSGSHVYQIAGYSLTQGMGIGRCLQSSAFTVAGHDWAVVFYPDGHGVNEDADHVSVFLTLLSDTAGPEDKDGGAVRAHIDFGLVDQRRSPPVIKKESRLSYSFASRGASAGYARFMSKAEVESSGLVHGDCLAVRCMVHVLRVREGEAAGTVAAAVPQAGVLTTAYRHVATKTWPALRQRFGTPEWIAFLLELLLRCLMVYVNRRLREDDDDGCRRRRARGRCRCKCGCCCCKA
ncbi:unnamed protein product [Urochloa decumbens]|uniref:MATH domain-containing protein n=1 Tax=Urochloa decumbens TaxID=240449 RepID=A0ABC8ZH47_9POAL